MPVLTNKYKHSIRFWLLTVLIPGIVGLMAFDSWNDYQTLKSITEAAYDSALLEPAKVLETSVEFDAGGSLRIDPPFYAQVMLESRAGIRKYFRVEEVVPKQLSLGGSADVKQEGQTLLGMRGLPRPPRLAEAEGVPVFYNAMYRSDTVRMVALWRDLHYEGLHRQVIVLVGESMGARLRVQQEAWRDGLLRDVRMVILLVLLIGFGVQWALRPLSLLRQEVRLRTVSDLKPLDVSHVPKEVIPLVNAVNHHLALYRRMLDRQAQFLADASHQLRTPLAIMRTQAQYARREPDLSRTRETLDAIIAQLGQTSRLTEQLLSLAHASHHDRPLRKKIDLNALAREVVIQSLPLARERRQDLGWLDFEGSAFGHSEGGQPIWVLGNDAELHESLVNLVHNAINHAGDAASITVSAGQDETSAWVSVSDNGPGLDPSLRESVFVRFDRGGAGRKGLRGSGSGLGLAISRAYAERNGATVVLKDGDANDAGGVGLCAVLSMPRFDR